MKFPYNDEYMIFDKFSHRYVLTEKDAFDNLAINLSERIPNENVRKRVLRNISIEIYNYIHSHNTANEWQDFIIAKTENGRNIIKEAMEEQLIYFLTVGDPTRTLDAEHRKMGIDEKAKAILLTTIPEIGTTILYTGKFPTRKICDWEW